MRMDAHVPHCIVLPFARRGARWKPRDHIVVGIEPMELEIMSMRVGKFQGDGRAASRAIDD